MERLFKLDAGTKFVSDGQVYIKLNDGSDGHCRCDESGAVCLLPTMLKVEVLQEEVDERWIFNRPIEELEEDIDNIDILPFIEDFTEED